MLLRSAFDRPYSPHLNFHSVRAQAQSTHATHNFLCRREPRHSVTWQLNWSFTVAHAICGPEEGMAFDRSHGMTYPGVGDYVFAKH